MSKLVPLPEAGGSIENISELGKSLVSCGNKSYSTRLSRGLFCVFSLRATRYERCLAQGNRDRRVG